MKPIKLKRKQCSNCRFWSQIFSGPKHSESGPGRFEAMCLKSGRYGPAEGYCIAWQSGHYGPIEQFNKRAHLYAEEEAA